MEVNKFKKCEGELRNKLKEFEELFKIIAELNNVFDLEYIKEYLMKLNI